MEYENRIIAFIDILGFKDIIAKSENDSNKLKVILDSLDVFKAKEDPKAWGLSYVGIEESAQLKGVDSFSIESKVNCTCFSDSIVVSVLAEGEEQINKA